MGYINTPLALRKATTWEKLDGTSLAEHHPCPSRCEKGDRGNAFPHVSDASPSAIQERCYGLGSGPICT